jgi:hypothetical protein
MSAVRKAIVAAALALSGSLGTAGLDGHLTAPEWLVAVLAGVAAAGAVWRVPNAPQAP